MQTRKLSRLHLDTLQAAQERCAAIREKANVVMQQAGEAVASVEQDAQRIGILVRLALGGPETAKIVGGVLQWEDEVPVPGELEKSPISHLPQPTPPAS